jgi:hypothetical protein
MVVASGWEEDTWRIHLDGCLALLQQSCQEANGTSSSNALEQALRFVQYDTIENFSFDTTTQNEKEKATLLLSILKLRLRSLVHEFCALTRGVVQPRKLDILRLRLLIKRLLNDLGLVLPTNSPATNCVSHTDRLECEALRVIAGTILMDCGRILDPTGSFVTTREYAKLNSRIGAAATEIFTITAMLHPRVAYSDTASVAHGNANRPRIATWSTPLSVIWPLFAAGIWASSGITQQTWARGTLFDIGERYKIPLALHLVRICCCFFPGHSVKMLTTILGN